MFNAILAFVAGFQLKKAGQPEQVARSAGREGPLMVSTCNSSLETHPRGQPHEAQHG
jgi:hypothetical protein